MKTIKLFSQITFGMGMIALLLSCEKIEGPYITPDESIPTTVTFPNIDTASVYRKILIEDFTAHKCTNCPDGHAILHDMINVYHDTLVAVALHIGSLAAPSASFPTDFRTTEGNTIETDFGPFNPPCAMVNRVQYNGEYSLDKDLWQTTVQGVDRSKRIAAIQIINEFDAANQRLATHTKTTIIDNYPNPVQLSLYITEDGIIAPQKVGMTTDTLYVHNHVLRGSMNGTYGVRISENGHVNKGEAYTKSYQMNFGGKNWNFANCKVIAILHDTETKEVIQVESCPFLNEN